MKDTFCMAVGALGAAIASLYGGWDAALQTLILFMAVDYVTGLIVAGVFHAQPQEPDRRAGEPCGLEGTDPQGRDPADRAGGLPAGRRDGNQLCAGRRGHRLYLQRDHFHR